MSAKRELKRLGVATAAAFLHSDSVLVLARAALTLRSVEGRQLGSLVALAGADAGYILSGDGPTFVELAGDAGAARVALSCRLGDQMHPFEVCSDTYEVSGLLMQLARGASYQDEP
jgi:hypothetical protein